MIIIFVYILMYNWYDNLAPDKPKRLYPTFLKYQISSDNPSTKNNNMPTSLGVPFMTNETKWHVPPGNTPISMGILKIKRSLVTYRGNSTDSHQTRSQ